MNPAIKTIRLIGAAAVAKPSPQIGQALGAMGINMMQFCKQFNAVTADYVDNIPLRVSLTVYKDQTFTFVHKSPATSWFIKQAAKIEKGAENPGHETIATIHVKQLYEIAKIKQAEMSDGSTVEGIAKTVFATCKSMGVGVSNASEEEIEKYNEIEVRLWNQEKNEAAFDD